MRSSALRFAMLASVLLTVPASAQSTPLEGTREQFESKLGYQTGSVSLNHGATIRVPEGFRFIGPEGSQRLLTEAWGNPPGSADGVLGMLVPADLSPLSRAAWRIVIPYEEEGWVNDSDAASTDYPKLLPDMREGAETPKKERQKQGSPAVTLVG